MGQRPIGRESEAGGPMQGRSRQVFRLVGAPSRLPIMSVVAVIAATVPYTRNAGVRYSRLTGCGVIGCGVSALIAILARNRRQLTACVLDRQSTRSSSGRSIIRCAGLGRAQRFWIDDELRQGILMGQEPSRA